MKTLYIECSMGAAGDMLMAALSELLPDSDGFIRKMNSLGIPNLHVEKSSSIKCGIAGSHISVTINGEEEESRDHDSLHSHEEHDHEHHGHSHDHSHEHIHEEHSHSHTHEHFSMGDIAHLINHLPVSEKVKADASAVYALIARAESHVHGVPVSEIHFHEVGTMDAAADIVGVCILMEQLGADKVIVSPIHVGSGQVHCAHGILPVPAPATAYILQGIPTYGGSIRGELCTPTGAALLKHFADSFAPMPPLAVSAIGYGMGKKDFPAANCVRVFLGEDNISDGPNGEIAELNCNLDDMTGEAVGFALSVLFENGALDAFTTPIQMKKNRPGIMLTCMCEAEDSNKMAKLILTHTTTFGVRKNILKRYMLDRSFKTVETPYGPVRVKTGTGYGIEKSKPEYEDIAKIAAEKGIALSDIFKL